MNVADQANAKKEPLGEKEALVLAQNVEEIYATKGKTVVHLDMKRDRPDAATLRRLLLGPSGNLRAPTLRKGKMLIVGFDEETYRRVFGTT